MKRKSINRKTYYLFSIGALFVAGITSYEALNLIEKGADYLKYSSILQLAFMTFFFGFVLLYYKPERESSPNKKMKADD